MSASFRPYQTEVNTKLFNDYMHSVKQPNYRPIKTLMRDSTSKEKDMMHYRMFKFHVNVGVKITKLHSMYRFKQSEKSAEFINHNTQVRPKARTNFERILYKRTDNDYLSKNIENVREKSRIHIIFPNTANSKDTKQIMFQRHRQLIFNVCDYKFNEEETLFEKTMLFGVLCFRIS